MILKRLNRENNHLQKLRTIINLKDSDLNIIPYNMDNQNIKGTNSLYAK